MGKKSKPAYTSSNKGEAKIDDRVVQAMACMTMIDTPQPFYTTDIVTCTRKERRWKWCPFITTNITYQKEEQREWLIKKPTGRKQILLEKLFCELGVDWTLFDNEKTINAEVGRLIAEKGEIVYRILALASIHDPAEMTDPEFVQKRTEYFLDHCTLADVCVAMSYMYLFCDKISFLNCMRYATMSQLSKPSPSQKGTTRRIQ